MTALENTGMTAAQFDWVPQKKSNCGRLATKQALNKRRGLIEAYVLDKVQTPPRALGASSSGASQADR